MNVRELYRLLSYGELSNLAISGEGSGNIIESKRPLIIVHLNKALEALFSRFNLREKTLMIELVDGVTNYRLHPMYAWTNKDVANVDHSYIVDNPDDPFTGDLIKVLSAFNEWGEIPLNEEHDIRSVFTPQVDILQVTNPIQGRTIALTYQAFHDPVLDDSLTYEIDIPKVLNRAVTAYIAHCVYSGMNTQEAKATAQEHMNMFEGVCLEVEEKNLLGIGSTTSVTKFERSGFV